MAPRNYCKLVFLFLFAIPSPANADDFNWHGFIAQGLIQAQNSNFINDDGDVSFELTEVGVNFSYQFNNTLRLAGQSVYLNGGNRYPSGLRTDYLFLDWSFVDTDHLQAKLLLGRLKNYHWLHSASRDVPHARPSIVLPQSVYFDAFRDFAEGSDGIGLLMNLDNQLGLWDFNWSLGINEFSEEQSKLLLGDLSTGDIDQEYDHQVSLRFTPHASNWQFGGALLDTEYKHEEGVNDIYYDGDVSSQRFLLDFKYSAEFWSVSSELFTEWVHYKGIVSESQQLKFISQGWYNQFSYFLTPKVTLLSRLEFFDLDKDDRSGRNRELLSRGAFPERAGYADAVTLGVNWQFADNWSLNGEFHRFKGIGRLAPILMPDTEINNQKYWNLWALQLTYWF